MKRTIVLAAAVCGMWTVPAKAIIYSFNNVTANNVVNAAAGGQLQVDVTSPGAGQVLFTFSNLGPVASSITDVYFDDGTLLGIATINNGPGVNFAPGANPPNLPGGNAINFNTTAGFLADSVAPAQPNGVNPGENLGILFNLINGMTFQDTINALTLGLANPGVDVTGGLRIGIHVQGFPNGGSEAFVNGPPSGGQTPVPDGGLTALLFGAAMTGLAVFRRSLGRKSG